MKQHDKLLRDGVLRSLALCLALVCITLLSRQGLGGAVKGWWLWAQTDSMDAALAMAFPLVATWVLAKASARVKHPEIAEHS